MTQRFIPSVAIPTATAAQVFFILHAGTPPSVTQPAPPPGVRELASFWPADTTIHAALPRIPVEEAFRRFADAWTQQTAHESSERRKVNHPAYRAIIGLGWPVVPSLLRDLDCGHEWFGALTEITGDNVAADTQTHEDAVDAWRAWGRHRNLV